MFDDLQTTQTPGTKLGAFLKNLTPSSDSVEYAPFALQTLPEGVSAASFRVGACNMLAANMPAELAVQVTGHDLTGISAFWEYLRAQYALVIVGAIVLAGWPRLPWGHLGRGPRPASLLPIYGLGVAEAQLELMIVELFHLDSSSPPSFLPRKSLWPLIEAAFASLVMWFEHRAQRGQMGALVVRMRGIYMHIFSQRSAHTAHSTLISWSRRVRARFVEDNRHLTGRWISDDDPRDATSTALGTKVVELQTQLTQVQAQLQSIQTTLAAMAPGSASTQPLPLPPPPPPPPPPPLASQQSQLDEMKEILQTILASMATGAPSPRLQPPPPPLPSSLPPPAPAATLHPMTSFAAASTQSPPTSTAMATGAPLTVHPMTSSSAALAQSPPTSTASAAPAAAPAPPMQPPQAPRPQSPLRGQAASQEPQQHRPSLLAPYAGNPTPTPQLKGMSAADYYVDFKQRKAHANLGRQNRTRAELTVAWLDAMATPAEHAHLSDPEKDRGEQRRVARHLTELIKELFFNAFKAHPSTRAKPPRSVKQGSPALGMNWIPDRLKELGKLTPPVLITPSQVAFATFRARARATERARKRPRCV
mmetsp:Transcript_18336/g.57683  ORF Transcript_18336/g.57683 Transcript_18336/m.57683 type:complete len:591 (+) Transcript_18336:611-2383(+)